MNKKTVLAILLGAVNVALTVVSFIFLPETVVTQFSSGASGATTMPKLLAVALPALFGLGGAAFALLQGGDEKGQNKALIVSAAGVLVFAIMLAVNL